MAEADLLQRRLLASQNNDGGWGYAGSSQSWTEPTALALLALASASYFGLPYDRGYSWLVKRQRSDGGWSPSDSVPTSTWVTNLVYLVLSDGAWPASSRHSASKWLLKQGSAPSNPFTRLFLRTKRVGPTFLPGGGSPWYPGTAAWVGPTASAILAASKARVLDKDPQFDRFICNSRVYLLSRRCEDGGWNHGGSSYRSENASSYPEMTGLALLGLANGSRTELSMSIRRAHYFTNAPQSIEGLSWLQLGLASLGETVDVSPTNLPCRTVSDVALRLLALNATSENNRLIAASRL